MIDGIEFQADLVVLKTEGLDVVLGMDWLRKHHGNISCRDRTVTLNKSRMPPTSSKSSAKGMQYRS